MSATASAICRRGWRARSRRPAGTGSGSCSPTSISRRSPITVWLEAIDANCQTKICFALQAADAKRMAPHFQPRLDAYDLQHLGSYTIACRVLHDARELPAATAATLPPPEPTPGDTAGPIRQRAHDQATERQAVEAAIRSRYGRIEQPPPGRAQADELDQGVLGVRCWGCSVGSPPRSMLPPTEHPRRP